jgi:hypothetical protein
MDQSERPIPEAVDQFLAQYVNSIEYLEILLLLADDAERQFTAAEVAREVYAVPVSATRRLEKIVADKLAEVTEESAKRYRFAPVDQKTRSVVAQVAQTYRERRVAVITLIASRPMENVRAFADAFRLGMKDKP